MNLQGGKMIFRPNPFLMTLLIGYLTLCSCSTHKVKPQDVDQETQSAKQAARSILESKSDSSVTGLLTISQHENGISIKGEVNGLKPNSVHAFHIHEKSSCSTPDASSAGGHFNPENKKHGAPQSQKSHAGDLGNIRADENGVVKIDKKVTSLKLYPLNDKHSVLGKTFIVHEHMDDLKSQPSGNAGSRIACGMIAF